MDKLAGTCKQSVVNNKCIYFSTTPTWLLEDMVVDCPNEIIVLTVQTNTSYSGSTTDRKPIISVVFDASASSGFWHKVTTSFWSLEFSVA